MRAFFPSVSMAAVAMRARPAVSPAPTPTPTPGLPAAASRVAHWDATTIAPQTDNTNLASWTDLINGLVMSQATSDNQPKYRTSDGAGAIGGQPCVQFDGSQLLEATQTGTALKAALDSGAYTVLAVLQSGSAGRNYGAIIAAATTNSGMILGHTGNLAGRYQGTARALVSFSTFMTCGLGGTASTGQRLVIDGGIVGQDPSGPNGTTGSLVRIGSIPGLAASFSMTGSICEIVVFDRELTPVEHLQFDDYARAKYGQPNPREGLEKFIVFEGDSITSGVGADYLRFSYPVLAAQAAGYQYGQFTNLARGGSTWTTMTTRAGQADAVVDHLGGIPCQMAVWEFYNQRALTTLIPDYVVPYLTARKAKGFRVTFGTTTDYLSPGSEKAAYCDYWDNPANRAGLIDDYVPLHDDTLIGVDGAQANSTYFLDFAHLTGKSGFPTTQSGYPVLASLFEPFL